MDILSMMVILALFLAFIFVVLLLVAALTPQRSSREMRRMDVDNDLYEIKSQINAE